MKFWSQICNKIKNPFLVASTGLNDIINIYFKM